LEVVSPSILNSIDDEVILAGPVGPAKLCEVVVSSITRPSLSKLLRKNPLLALLEIGFLKLVNWKVTVVEEVISAVDVKVNE
jgi:hypothetical protein